MYPLVSNMHIVKLKSRKYPGPENISAASLKFSNKMLYGLLCLCFTVGLTHTFLPKALLKTTIISVV